jgi:hypothetical protein
MSCKINCPVHNEKDREFVIGTDNRIWPCCNYFNAWENDGDSDRELLELYQNDTVITDPDWNKIEKYTLDNILNSDLIQKYFFIEGWNSESPPPICQHCCGDQ